jgi:hypothetical protein
VAMIKALRVLDPSDLLLNHVAGPVRRYLKQRKDAVRLAAVHVYMNFLAHSITYIHTYIQIR